METWESRLSAVVHGSNPLPEQEWVRFYQMLSDWITCIEEAAQYSGQTQREEDRNAGKEHITSVHNKGDKSVKFSLGSYHFLGKI